MSVKRKFYPRLEEILNSKNPFVNIIGDFGTGKSTVLNSLRESLKRVGYKVVASNGTTERGNFGTIKKGLSKSNIEEWINEPYTKVNSVFFTSPDGITIIQKNAEDIDVDTDILGAMVTAVQTFVKDSFSNVETQENLEKIKEQISERVYNIFQYEDYKIATLKSENGGLICMFSGEQPDSLKHELNEIVDVLEEKHGKTISNWNGNLSSVQGLESLFEPLMNKYLGNLFSGSAEDKKIFLTERFFRNLEKTEKIVFLIDDIDNADSETVYLLNLIPNLVKDIKIITTSENKISLSKKFEELQVSNFEKEEFNQFVDEYFTFGSPPQDFIDELFEKTEGNPFLANVNMEMFLKNEINFSDWKNELIAKELFIYSSVDEIIKEKLKEHGEKAYSVIEHAALMERFNANQLTAVMGFETGEYIAKFKKSGIISGEEEIYFSSERIKNIVEKDISEIDIYVKIADFYESYGEDYKKIAKLYSDYVIKNKEKEINVSAEKSLDILRIWANEINSLNEPFSKIPFELVEKITEDEKIISDFSKLELLTVQKIQDYDAVDEIASKIIENRNDEYLIGLAYAYRSRAKYKKRKFKEGIEDAKKAIAIITQIDESNEENAFVKGYAQSSLACNLREIIFEKNETSLMDELEETLNDAIESKSESAKIDAIITLGNTYCWFYSQNLVKKEKAIETSNFCKEKLVSKLESIDTFTKLKICTSLMYQNDQLKNFEESKKWAYLAFEEAKQKKSLQSENLFAARLSYFCQFTGDFETPKKLYETYAPISKRISPYLTDWWELIYSISLQVESANRISKNISDSKDLKEAVTDYSKLVARFFNSSMGKIYVENVYSNLNNSGDANE